MGIETLLINIVCLLFCGVYQETKNYKQFQSNLTKCIEYVESECRSFEFVIVCKYIVVYLNIQLTKYPKFIK